MKTFSEFLAEGTADKVAIAKKLIGSAKAENNGGYVWFTHKGDQTMKIDARLKKAGFKEISHTRGTGDGDRGDHTYTWKDSIGNTATVTVGPGAAGWRTYIAVSMI